MVFAHYEVVPAHAGYKIIALAKAAAGREG
jgi:hypothetical protein